MVVQNVSAGGRETDLTFTIKLEDLKKARRLVENNKYIKFRKLIVNKKFLIFVVEDLEPSHSFQETTTCVKEVNINLLRAKNEIRKLNLILLY